MRTKYDPQTDTLCVRFAETAVFESEETRPGVVLDLDVDGRIVAIELLDASKQVSGGVDKAFPSAA
ncbi:MAG TPA: DUF2283 domain-containing protein [Lichenihabitans sp.]|jgi:uncharacterized protein YuzE|nr:DUF2283 domain-containing protein [Lichenihabitans sp.]